MEIKNALWEMAIKINNLNSKDFRLGAAGAVIKYDKYGEQTSFGWNIDHRNPNGGNGINNLRAMHWENNLSKSNQYPCYTRVIVYVPQANRNSYIEKTLCVSHNLYKDE